MNPMDCSPPDSSVHEILQARILDWVAIPFSRGSSQPRIKAASLALQADSLPTEPPGKPPLYYRNPTSFIIQTMMSSMAATGQAL